MNSRQPDYWTAIRVLQGLALALIVLAIVSTLVILSGRSLKLDPSHTGWKNALDIFAFPLACLAGLAGVVTLETAVRALLESARQSATASWAQVQSSFMEYCSRQTRVPLSAFDPDPFRSRYSDNWRDEVFQVDYLAPMVTIRRLFDWGGVNKSIDPPIAEDLEQQIHRLGERFHRMAQELAAGNERWLVELVNLGVVTRQLRTYLAVRIERMTKWQASPILDYNEDLGETPICPPYDSLVASSVISAIWTELLCIANVLAFSKNLEPHAREVAGFALSLKQFREGADELQKILAISTIELLWRETHLVAGRKATL